MCSGQGVKEGQDVGAGCRAVFHWSGSSSAMQALGPQSQPETTLRGKGSPLRADEIVLISDTQGHNVYINTGALLSTSPSHGSRPLGPTQPSAPWPEYQVGAAGAVRGEVSLPERPTTAH
jgi:hypothetical protein